MKTTQESIPAKINIEAGEIDKKIQQKIQRSNFDCGQTCLDMLGYDGHTMFPDKEIHSPNLKSIPGTKNVTVPIGQEETLDYTTPHVWIFLEKKGEQKVIKWLSGRNILKHHTTADLIKALNETGHQHWVIRYKDKIYCPKLGIIDAKKYKKQFIAFVLQEFIVPFNNQDNHQDKYEKASLQENVQENVQSQNTKKTK